MSTNYYFHKRDLEPCSACGRGYDSDLLHIGKSSYGRVFSLHVIPDLGLNDWPDWERFLRDTDGEIRDEYRKALSLDELRQIVTDRSWHGAPDRLRRGKIDGVFCVGHGAGTWDLLAGEFS